MAREIHCCLEWFSLPVSIYVVREQAKPSATQKEVTSHTEANWLKTSWKWNRNHRQMSRRVSFGLAHQPVNPHHT